MSKFDFRLRVIAIPVLLGLGLIGAAANASLAKSASPTLCGINAQSSGGMIALQAAFKSDVAVNGSYQLRIVTSGPGGSSNVSQGGGFSAAANDVVTLGQVSVNSGSTYQIDFKVNANGVDLDCSQEIASLD